VVRNGNDYTFSKRSPLYPTLIKVFKTSLDEALNSGDYLADYSRNADRDISDEEILEHWREASHGRYQVVIFAMVKQVYGEKVEQWARKWFRDNKPQWLALEDTVTAHRG
jgi:hypothetical protein